MAVVFDKIRYFFSDSSVAGSEVSWRISKFISVSHSAGLRNGL